ncbi:MAG: DUF4864 domain-containing protein [Tepidisphaeraceae bacterium]
MKNVLLILQSVLLLTLGAAWLVDRQTTSAMPAAPTPRLSSDQVVEAQLAALRRDNADGIRECFAFASPANRESVGPIEHFTQLVRGPAYAPLLGTTSGEVVSTQAESGVARHLVRIVDRDGQTHHYLFALTRQNSGEYRGCWMTESVQPLEPSTVTGETQSDQPREAPLLQI